MHCGGGPEKLVWARGWGGNRGGTRSQKYENRKKWPGQIIFLDPRFFFLEIAAPQGPRPSKSPRNFVQVEGGQKKRFTKKNNLGGCQYIASLFGRRLFFFVNRVFCPPCHDAFFLRPFGEAWPGVAQGFTKKNNLWPKRIIPPSRFFVFVKSMWRRFVVGRVVEVGLCGAVLEVCVGRLAWWSVGALVGLGGSEEVKKEG